MEGATDHDNTSLRVASFSCYLDTAKENLVHKISAQEVPFVLSSGKPQHPPTKPPFNSHFTHSIDTKDSLTNLRVDSFSYLNTPPEKFVFNVPAPIPDPTPFTFPQEPRKNGEISIFGADKYFSMKLDCQMEMIKRDSNNVNLPRAGSNPKPRNPILCSEASTWNSQTNLLPILHRNGSQTKQKKAFGRRILSGFGCKGPCFDKKGVRINKLVTRTGSERIDQKENLTVNQQQEKQEEVANIEESRTSIEVFGSNTTLKGDYVAKNMERKLSMLTWDAIPKAKNLPTSTVGSATICDDMASEASSDLFEIENISGAIIHPILATDDMSMSPTSHYAPSEASIQWSVVTASAADYPASDYNDETSTDVMMSKNNSVNRRSCKSRNGGGKEAQKSRNGGLLGCRSLKAVDVAENVSQKANEKAKHQGLELSVSLGKSQATLKH